MNIFQFISVQVLRKRIRGGEGGQSGRLFAYKGGGGGSNFGKSAYIILERSPSTKLIITNREQTCETEQMRLKYNFQNISPKQYSHSMWSRGFDFPVALKH